MSSTLIALLVFLGCISAAAIGMFLHAKLPNRHFDGDSKDTMKLVMGLIATLAALVLSLLVASAKNSYDTQGTELQQLSTQIVQLDQMLALYGPETQELRHILRQALITGHERIWPAGDGQPANLDPAAGRAAANVFYAKLQNLTPKTEAQTRIQSAAWQSASSLLQVRMLMYEQVRQPIAWQLLAILIFWVSVLFLGFGLFSQFHLTLGVTLAVGALSVASAIFLILEMNQPYAGWMRLSDAPFRSAIAAIGQ
ncbi:MAG TPA: hypothetical protein VK726_16695 [Acetobacteraceae bacterium]|jgi:hypothetical protein|nr:hypothetical protein [Acetobacteraceae bacterium]